MLPYDQVRKELEELIADHPGFVYYRPSVEERPPFANRGVECLYVHRNPEGVLVPGCIIGHWVIRYRGVEPLRLIDDAEGTSVGDALDALGIAVDAEGRQLLDKVQTHQDEGMAWDVALDQAIGEVDELRGAEDDTP